MPLEENENDPEQIDSRAGESLQKKAFSKAPKGIREGRRGRAAVAIRRSSSGLDPREAIHEWLIFAQARGHHRITGKRQFASNLDRVETCLEEEEDLFDFCRAKVLNFAENIASLLEGPATREGVEHRVFYSLADDPPRVTKITFPGKYGRIEHTPFLYLERLALFNELFPELDIRFEDCIKTNKGEFSLFSTMRAFSGAPPDLKEIDAFLIALGFAKFSDGSITIDYINSRLGIILRDCHPKNWVKNRDGTLIPIDLCPEIA
jgi:hypothetical protein